MAYTINGKVYTSHPLMDEIVYACKTILNGIVLKNEKVANNYETADSLTESDAFLAIMNDAMHLEILPISEQFLLQHGFSPTDAANMSHNITLLPEYVECKLIRYDEHDTKVAEWNPELARYEFVTGGIAGYNDNSTVVTLEDGVFKYTDGTVCDSNRVIALKEEYYIDSNGKIVLQDEDDPEKFYNLDGTDFLATPIKCMAGIIREFANDYPRNEQNLYYRTLNAMPAYGTDYYDVYVDADRYQYLLELDESNSDFNFDIPIHEFTTLQINTLDSLGILNEIIDEYYTNAEPINKPYYKYLNYLGSKKIDVYNSRFAKEWDILYMPPVEHLVSDRFKEAYKINRDIYYRRTYQQAYSLYSDYYEEVVMIMILCQTFTDLVVDTPEFYIRRDIFDLRTAQYFLEANGVAFYGDIPLKYQVLLIKNLNKLIKYKSTMQNIRDILDIFSMGDSIIYKFYLFKKYLYNRFEVEEKDYYGNDENIEEAGWYRTDLIVNSNFENGDYAGWSTDFTPSDEVGVTVAIDYISQNNLTPYLKYYNNTDEPVPLSIYQVVHDVPVGTYRIRVNLDGTDKVSTGLRFYVNDNLVMGTKVTKGGTWIDVVSTTIDIPDTTDLTISYSGEIPAHYTGKVDNIYLETYEEDYDCGYEDDIDGIISYEDPDIETVDCYDESGTDEYLTQVYMYDFGFEDSGAINTGEATDAVFDYTEANRIIYDDAGNVYDLEFVKVPLGEGYDDYIKDSIYRQQYDSVVRQDKYWNGQDTHNYIKNLHLAKDFTIEGSKFMGLEFNIPYQEYAFQKQYYLSMYLNADLNTNDIKISVPSIKQNAQFSIQDLIIFVYCCNDLYEGEVSEIIDTSSKFIKYTEREVFNPYHIVDGGHSWDEDTGQELPEPEPEEDWDTPDLDFGYEDDPNFKIVKDQFLQILDFGLHVTIDYNDPNTEWYEYGDESSGEHEVSDEQLEEELNEPDPWPFQDLCEFGDENISKEVNNNGDISLPVIRTSYTKIYDMGDEDEWIDPDLPVDRTNYIYDFNAQTAGTVDYIESPNTPIYNGDVIIYGFEFIEQSGEHDYQDPDAETIYPEEDYDRASFVPYTGPANSYSEEDYDLAYLAREIGDNETVIDCGTEYPKPPLEYFPAYYIQNKTRTLFKLYEYDPATNAYVLSIDYSTIEDDEPWQYDVKDTLTMDNYIKYLGHFVIDMNTGEYTKLTVANYKNFLGKLLRMRFPWYNVEPGTYTEIIDGHHIMHDKDWDDVIFNPDTMNYYKLDGTLANGGISLIEDKYKQVFDGGKIKYTLDPTVFAYYDWLRNIYPDRWIPLTGRIYAFNMKADLNQLAKDIGERHSLFGWSRGFTLAECGVDKFITKTKITDINTLYDIYETNTNCYYNIIEKMENASTRDEKQILEYVYYTLFTKPFDRDNYMLKTGDLATRYEEMLVERDYSLYNYYLTIKNEEDPEVRREILKNTLNSLVDTLSYYISGDNLKYVLTFITTNSNDSVLGYMTKIINFFKSWKVYFLEPHNTYIVNDKYNHMIYMGDTITEAKISDWHTDTFASRDSLVAKVKYDIKEENKIAARDGTYTSNTHKGAMVVDVANHYTDQNILDPKIYDGNIQEDDYYDIIEANFDTEEHPYYIIDGGRVEGRHNSHILDGGGPGLLTREQFTAGYNNGAVKFVNLPRPQDDPLHVTVDGGNERDREYPPEIDTSGIDINDFEMEWIDGINYDDCGDEDHGLLPEILYATATLSRPLREGETVINCGEEGYDVSYATGNITDIEDTPESPDYNTASIHPEEILPVIEGGNEDTITGVSSRGILLGAGDDEEPEENPTEPEEESKVLVYPGMPEDYVVDGGWSSNRVVYSNTAITTIDERNEINVEVRLATVPENLIQIVEEDGLFVNKYDFVSRNEYLDVEYNISSLKLRVEEEVNTHLRSLYAFGSPEQAETTITEIHDNFFHNSMYVLDKLKTDIFEHDVQDKINGAAVELTEWFKEINPFATMYENTSE